MQPAFTSSSSDPAAATTTAATRDSAGAVSDASSGGAAVVLSGSSSSASTSPHSSPVALTAAADGAVSVGLSVFSAPSSSSSLSVDGRLLESAVVSYLRKRGYAWTEEQLNAIRSGSSGDSHNGGDNNSQGSSGELSELAMDVSLDVHACLSNSLFTAHPRLSTPEQFEWTYSRLRSFVSSSLDVYALELRLVLWPLFLHSFLSLHLRGYPGDAVLFFSSHRKDHEALHSSELTLLSHVHSDQHIRQHDYTRLALSRRIELTMSAFTCELLTSYIEAEGLVTAAHILTDHTLIKILSRRPWKAEQSSLQQHSSTTTSSSSSAADRLAGQSHAAVAAINSVDVRWGALADIVRLQSQAREQLKDTVRAQQRREQQQTREGDNKDSGTRPMDVEDGRPVSAVDGSGGVSDSAANQWAESDQAAVQSTLGGEDDMDDEGGVKGKGGRRSRRSGKKERKERGGRKSLTADDSVARVANEQIPVFKHTIQLQTVELPDIAPEHRQAYIDDLSHSQYSSRHSRRHVQP